MRKWESGSQVIFRLHIHVVDNGFWNLADALPALASRCRRSWNVLADAETVDVSVLLSTGRNRQVPVQSIFYP